MLKVFGFVKRNPRLTHDEYRAGHVGYHNSFGRRLNNIRGYLLNVASNRPISDSLGAEAVEMLTTNAPADFDDGWDGWGQLMFDHMEDYVGARSPARDHAGPNGLDTDTMVAKVGDDFDQLYAGSPFQFQVDEHIAMPVRRPERKLFKLAQFIKKPATLAPELFRAYLTGRYATLAATMPGLRGMIVNVRTNLDVMTKFFAADAEGFTPEGIARREAFYEGWDVLVEYWFDEPAQFSSARLSPGFEQLREFESVFFSAVFYREVDETVAVLPKRNTPPPFYHR
ncbi:MAG TPA: hypothetical protein EYP91_04120 [Gammaproteobacteria bacterium]|jgi:hypothetical protein|nr:hypothetical protein [Gammaproteobacteria bacterium]